MENRICYLIVGSESSGNRLVARILSEAGCYGSTTTDQPGIAKLLKEANGRPAVAIRSFPHGAQGADRHWPNLEKLCGIIRDHNYHPYAIVTTRDFHCCTQSKVSAGHVETLTKSRSTTKSAYCKIFREIDSLLLSYVYVTYEGLVLHPQETVDWLLEYVGLPATKFIEEITDENKKWYAKT